VRRTVFLHIGEPKSGSSYLQALMWANQSFLRRHGILLPGRGPADHYQAGSDLQGDPVRDGRSRRPEAWQWLIDRIDASDARAAIISDERLTRTRAAPIRRALDSLRAHDVRVILAVREFGGLAASEWQQVVKMGGTAQLDDWLDRLVDGELRQFTLTHDIGDVLRRWCLPPEHVHLLIVPPAGADRNELWRRFATIVDAPAELPTAASRSNASMGLDETELVRRLYEQFVGPPPPGPIQSVMRGVVSRQILSPREAARSIRLPEACLPWMEAEAERRKAVVATSGCRVVGEVHELDLDRSRFVGTIEPPESARMLDAAVDVIDRLTRRVSRRRQSRFGPLAAVRERIRAVVGRDASPDSAPANRSGDPTQVELLRRLRERLGARQLDEVTRIMDLDPSPGALTARSSTPTDAGMLDLAVQISARLVEELAELRVRATPRGRLAAGLRRLA
jgi:hypothetical protein